MPSAALFRCYNCLTDGVANDIACNPSSNSSHAGSITVVNCTSHCSEVTLFVLGSFHQRHLHCDPFCTNHTSGTLAGQQVTTCCTTDLCNHPFPVSSTPTPQSGTATGASASNRCLLTDRSNASSPVTCPPNGTSPAPSSGHQSNCCSYSVLQVVAVIVIMSIDCFDTLEFFFS